MLLSYDMKVRNSWRPSQPKKQRRLTMERMNNPDAPKQIEQREGEKILMSAESGPS